MLFENIKRTLKGEIMNAVKRQRPTISQDDIERLLFHLEDARAYVIKYGAAQGFHSIERAMADKTHSAIDDFAGQITGNREYFWQTTASAGGSEIAYQRGMDKAAKRRRLMGVNFPVRALRIQG